MLSQSRLFVFLCLAFIAGIFAASLFKIPPQGLYIALGFFVICFAIAFFSGGLFHPVALASLFVGVALLGAARLEAARVPSEYQNSFGNKQSIEGYIMEDPDIRTDKQLLTVRPKGFRQNVLVTTTLAQRYAYGDWVVVEGKIEQPKNFDDFDYQSYLERFHVYGVVAYPHVLILKNNQGSWAKQQLLLIKHAFVRRAEALLAEPYGSLLVGILIGAKKTLPQNIVDNFNTTGLSHVVAVSGFNITIIISSLTFLAHYLGRKASFIISLLIILGFIVISGASASVVRAGIMGCLLLCSFQIGRMYAITPAICAAAVCMLIGNPMILFYDIGFQLSFAATVGIVYFAPLLDALTANWHDAVNILEFRKILIATCSAILFTLPLILFYFGRLSLVAPLANILVLPFVPLVMLFGFLIVIPFVGAGFAFASWLLMAYMTAVINRLAAWPHAAVSVKISGVMVWALTAAIIGLYVWLKRIVALKTPLEAIDGNANV